MNLRLPNITATTDAGKLQEIHGFLYQLVQELNWALSTVDNAAAQSPKSAAPAPATASGSDSISTFNSIKSLIIKSADIVNAYYDKISKRLEGVYVAQSDFGTFKQNTTQDILANSTAIEQFYANLQEIITDVAALDTAIISTNAHINSGLLGYDSSGAPIYGVEVGQRTEKDGVEIFNKYAQFTSAKLSFFDRNGYEVAYISDRKLYITDVEITGSMIMGGFKRMVVPGVGVVTKWIGGTHGTYSR